MLDPVFLEALVRRSSPEQVRSYLAQFFPEGVSADEKAKTVAQALLSSAGQSLRAEIGKWIVEQYVPVASLVPEEYANWRPPVRDAMLYVVGHLSPARLAPKLLEQLDLPANTAPEVRLLRLIAKVPGLQKLGQVIARNRHLRPALRTALSELENGIQDVDAEQIDAIIRQQLGTKLGKFEVQIEPALRCEASVSAIVRFTWVNPRTKQRQPGVFKVLKPFIPACFAEDMDLLQGLTEYFATRYRNYGVAKDVLTDTFSKVRKLLQHETHFRGEQKTLLQAARLYRDMPKVRVPQVFPQLCTATITAMSEEQGLKVTEAAARLPLRRRKQLAQQLIEALIAVPLFSTEEKVLFHADPHAGNLFYDVDRGELILLDWALTERLTREQRRHLALLICMVGLRDPVGTFENIRALSQTSGKLSARTGQIIRDTIASFFAGLPLTRVPNAVDAMRLVQWTGTRGVRFAAPLIMLSKVLFTLDGVVFDIRGSGVSLAYTVARHGLQTILQSGAFAGLPLGVSDLVRLQASVMLYGGRLSIRVEQAVLNRLLPQAGGGPITATNEES